MTVFKYKAMIRYTIPTYHEITNRSEKQRPQVVLQRMQHPDHFHPICFAKVEYPVIFADHPAIINEATFNAAQEALDRIAAKNPSSKSKQWEHHPFTGMILCAGCGKPYRHVKNHDKSGWACPTYIMEGKAFCESKRILEEEIMRLACDLFGWNSFDEDALREAVDHITAVYPYRFAPEIYEALLRQPLTGNLPQECLCHMPEWAVYIETPGLTYERIPMEGFIAHLDYNLFSRGVDLQFAIFREGIAAPKMIALPLGEGTLLDAMDRVDRVDDMLAGPTAGTRYVGSRNEYRQTFFSMLQLLLYICSDEPDMPEIEHPQQRRRLSGGVRSPEAPRIWDVGVRVSAAIRRFNGKAPVATESGAAPGSHASPRPHVRSAHWHTYWTGPRDAVFPLRKPVMRWIPPLPIGMDWKRELPTSIKVVGG